MKNLSMCYNIGAETSKTRGALLFVASAGVGIAYNPIFYYRAKRSLSGGLASRFGCLSNTSQPGKGRFIMTEEWQGEVYHQETESKHWNRDGGVTPYWKKIRREALKNDNFTCQRCGYLDDLTIHHITPRAVGGGDNLENLIALCIKCHDEVEILGFRSRWEIVNVFDGEYSIDDDREENDDWHSWVYGAGRKPRK